MRNHFIDRLTENAEHHTDIMLVSGDLGFSVLENFASKFSKRCINAGIAEQNMTSVAAGLALEGNKVFTYSIGNFPTLRCLEQIRNDVCYHNADVKIIAVGGGFAYGALGVTHHATEDIAVLRALPNMKIYVPCDFVTAEKTVDLLCEQHGPAYVRLEKGKERAIFSESTNIDIEKLQCLRKGMRIAVLCVGTIVSEALAVAEKYEVSVYLALTVKPIDRPAIEKLAYENEVIITLEEHNEIGGFGSAVAEVISELPCNCRLVRFGLQDVFTSVVGTQKYLRQYYGLSAESIGKKIEELL